MEPRHNLRRCRCHLRSMNLLFLHLWISLLLVLLSCFLLADIGSVAASSTQRQQVPGEDEAIYADDDTLEDELLSDYDDSLEILGDDESNTVTYDMYEIKRQQKQRKQYNQPTKHVGEGENDDDSEQEESYANDEHEDDQSDDSVIIMSSVDGALAGISRTSGRLLWRQSNAQLDGGTQQGSGGKGSTASPVEWSKFLSPLVSTSSAKLLANSNKHIQDIHQSYAIPSVDGTVYLSSAGSKSGHRGSGDNSGESHALSTVAHVRDLVDRAPFVDAQQRFFVGSRKAMVAAVDESTGEILRVIPKWNGGDDNGRGGDDDNLPPSLEGRDVVWIGRLEHHVMVHDLHKGTVDVEFSVAEILSVDEMVHGDRGGNREQQQQRGQEERTMATDVTQRRQEEEVERLLTDMILDSLRHPSDGDRILRLPAPEGLLDEDVENDGNPRFSSIDHRKGGGQPFLVSTPNGNVAFRDFHEESSNSVGWVAFDLMESPVVYAIEASSGRKIRVNMLSDDNSVSSSASVTDELPPLLELEQQIASLVEQQLLPSGVLEETSCNGEGECRAVQTMSFSTRGSVVGSLQNGQIYALPLGERISERGGSNFPLGLPQPPLASSGVVNVNGDNAHAAKLNTQQIIGFHAHDSNVAADADAGDNQYIHLSERLKQSSCAPGSEYYPGCLIGASLMMGNLLDVNGNLDMASVFASSDLDYDLYLDMLEQGGTNRKRSKLFQKFLKIMSSWIAPTVALLFVVSFEVGRRERIKALKAKSTQSSESLSSGGGNDAREENPEALSNIQQNSAGVIEVSEEILGYGGHGTIVYRGILDKRQVAVKRLLNLYHASADREISLLIESDGHPNVVRYFLKESRGDFVYLALELCDMSLNDLIVSLSKLRNIRKENFQLGDASNGADDFESATKSLLLQISSGVRHIHSLRIVHRDLKPQNILLRWQPTDMESRNRKSKCLSKQESSGSSDSEVDTVDENTTHSASSDTNAILESFKNQEYVPKISDMGLGKQLAGQSSFGLSTLGTGSVGGGANGTAGDAGAGAGSVGWQAPEVMAMRVGGTHRWTDSEEPTDASSTELEASPLETSGMNTRTSRSVDIFSLGCIFYCTILPGSHPFGEWYEREANIMKNNPNKEDLEFVSPDASDLILSMIHRQAKARPTAEEVCEHPFFWPLARRLAFLCDLSDRIELTSGRDALPELNVTAIESGAADIFGSSWEKRMDPELIEASLSRRTYDPSSVRDCLRMIRNKHHHYDELPKQLKIRIGSLSSYISRSFPKLLMHCYRYCVTNLSPDDELAAAYKLPITRYLSLKARKNKQAKDAVVAVLSPLDEAKNNQPPLETIPDDDADDDDDAVEQEQPAGKTENECILPLTPELDEESDTSIRDGLPSGSGEASSFVTESVESPSRRWERVENKDGLSGIVVWSGSNTAKELSCRGWYRSDDEWVQRLDSKLSRKRDANLTRCADDPKFRTRLCNHWDVSSGEYCPMKKKNKCIFAHGPVELRVKEGKRHRWGTLVRKDGLCANPKASGGEDTYGAARSIEKTRQEKGQWTVDRTKMKQGKGKQKGSKQSPKKNSASK